MFLRVLLATICDNGLCPCPRCLMPKTKLDRIGRRWDVGFRLKSVRQYLADKVRQARNIVYKLGQAVSGTGVDGVLKSTSSVPVIVSVFPAVWSTVSNWIWDRMLSLNGSEKILISHGWWSLTLCMSLNLESGKLCSHIWFASSMQRLNTQVLSLMSWMRGTCARKAWEGILLHETDFARFLHSADSRSAVFTTMCQKWKKTRSSRFRGHSPGVKTGLVIKSRSELTLVLASALSQYLKASSLSHSTEWYSGFCTRLRNGTRLPNSGCTLILPSIFLKRLRKNLDTLCNNFATRLQMSSTPWNSLVTPTHVTVDHVHLRRRN